jgi:hypothetical protein
MSPTEQVPEVDGVAWFPDPRHATLFTAVGREAYVEVTISQKHVPGNVLVDLAGPINKALPH